MYPFLFSIFPLKCLLRKLNIFQIMYLLIGVYNTKTELKLWKFNSMLARV